MTAKIMGAQKALARTKEITVMAMLAALMFGAKMVMAPLPNIEPVSILIIVYVSVLGLKALIPVYVYVFLEIFTWGLGYWSICYLYVWAVLALIALCFRKMESPLGWAVLSGAFGLSFGALCALVYLVAKDWAFALSWWVSSIPFDLAHGAGNFVMALVLFRPCKRVLVLLTRQSIL